MPKKILLADDSITIQKVVELTFSDGDYDVVAVNNGAKAIQKLAELRPDIILSDIIMPEKNGYEVCEYVKSHPDLRNIPVILLTGTFEPFDPDRAEKAGCDAVVTKPFESQSLIHKVEELVAQAQANAQSNAQANAAPPAPPVPEPTPWADEPAPLAPPAAPSYEPVTAAYEPPSSAAFGGGAEEVPFAGSGSSSFNASSSAFSPSPEPFAGGFQTHGGDIFGAGQAAESPATTEMPFDTPQPEIYGGETRAFQKMDFDELQRLAGAQPAAVPPPPAPPAAPSETSPWDEPPAFGGETRAFPRMSFEELQQMGSASAPSTPEPAAPWNEPAAAPWDEPTAPTWGDETSSLRRSDLGEFTAPAAPEPSFSAPQTSPWDEPAATPPPPAAETSPWDQGHEEQAFGGETRAFPRMSFEELQQMGGSTAPPATSEPPAAEPSSPWDEPAAFAGETRAFPKMSFEEMQQMASPAAAEAHDPEPVSPGDEPASAPEPAAPAEPEWSTEAHEEVPEPTAYATGAQSYETPAFETAAYETPDVADEGNEGHGVAPLFAGESYSERFVADSYEPEPYSSESYGNASTAPVAEPENEESPFASGEELVSEVASPAWPSIVDEPDPTAAYEAAELHPTTVNPQITDAVTDAASEVVGAGVQLSEAQIEQIARRVVELMSEQVVRSIAWEVIPDVAQMMVKERIRQLESEA